MILNLVKRAIIKGYLPGSDFLSSYFFKYLLVNEIIQFVIDSGNDCVKNLLFSTGQDGLGLNLRTFMVAAKTQITKTAV